MIEWSERQGNQLNNLVELYDREAIKATDQLYELINFSDVPLELPINWRDVAMLGPPFLWFL